MADLPPVTEPRTGETPHRTKEPPRTPRWVIVFGIVVIVLVLLFLVLHLTGMVPMHMSMQR